MNKDLQLKSDELKLILLIVGDHKVGKKTIVKGIIRENDFNKKEQDSFTSYFFVHEETIGKSKILIPIELRVLKSEELNSELKLNKTIFNDSFGAFVVSSITDNNSFINGEKWKNKIDLLCCLPNRFPIPIFLLINKCDIIANEDEEENKQNFEYIQKEKIETYSLENQFFNTFLLGKCEEENNLLKVNTEKNDDNKISINNNKNEENIIDLMVSPITPFKEIVKIIMGFKDIRDRFVIQSGVNINEYEYKEENKSKKCIVY